MCKNEYEQNNVKHSDRLPERIFVELLMQDFFAAWNWNVRAIELEDSECSYQPVLL